MEKQKILAVDDTPENLDVVRSILGGSYNILLAVNGTLALKIARAQQPSLILLDIMMPGMDGYEVCQQLKSDPQTKHIPIIFLTAKDQVEDEVKGFILGAADFILKPISPPILQSRVVTHLALADQRRDLENQVAARTADLRQTLSQLEETNCALQRSIEETQATQLEIVRRLGRASDYRDNETGLHVIRMSNYAKVLALAAGFSVERAELLLNAAPMHDVGKIGVPDFILLKPGKLDEAEWHMMRQHPHMGADIIGEHDNPLMVLAREVALTHHEKWNGTGYPQGLKGEEIPISGRIVAIADVFDALTTQRPYKKAWSVEKAVDLLKQERGIQFDPLLVDHFLRVLPTIIEIKERYAEESIPPNRSM
ncbi:response regulator receiver modulated metal dependent phosphohydrolase [Magnetococcus marinus MC-1]|uniref:Response regulator receiver modulated metal dependent phosphohydrolase n=1 Tax=Magnetococcus marinus (strain ATCC BAA-1437 / JCM 17883 / MC-1) TaxID=156889 RepID=A0LCG2_MAGMM|nr:two-component system response regulator [Magnetococcus marinus]ABK45655.1 response regulator receiver modulated metal dependent phosphohydrolase [Magnetococcus marinus MC-1]